MQQSTLKKAILKIYIFLMPVNKANFTLQM